MLGRRAFLGGLGLLLACSKRGAIEPTVPPRSLDIDGDVLALFPSGPLVLANVDAKAFYASGLLASDLGKLTETLLPVGDEVGLVPSRDIDRVVIAAYSTQGDDVTTVLRGRFEPDKIERAARSHTMMQVGSPLVASSYGDRTVYTVANVGFSVLSAKTVVAGTETSIRRVLDRVQDGRGGRDSAPWMYETLETKGAAFALAADFTSQPVASIAVGSVSLPFLKGMRLARVIGNFADRDSAAGIQIAATLTYGGPEEASEAADGIRSVDRWTRMVGSVLQFVPQVQGLEVSTDKNDLRAKCFLDEKALRGAMKAIPGFRS